MITNIIIGYGIFLFFNLYLCFKLDDEHKGLKFFLIGISIFSLSLLPIITQDCSFLNQGYYNYNVYGNNFTYSNGSVTYHWDYSASGVPPTADKGVFLFHTNQTNNYDYVCSDQLSQRLVKPIYYIQIFFIAYMFIYILWVLLTKYSKVGELVKSKFKKW